MCEKVKKPCLTRNCLNKAAKGRAYCYKCNSRKFRKNNPLKAAYNDHKQNAKRRKIESSLTFEEFKELAMKFEVVTAQGEIKQFYHLDRINALEGYTKANCRFITASENCSKAYSDKLKHIQNKMQKHYGIIQLTLLTQ